MVSVSARGVLARPLLSWRPHGHTARLAADGVAASPPAAPPRPAVARLAAVPAGVWSLTRRHLLFSVTLAVATLLRVVAVLAYPGVLWFYGDSYMYLGAAMRLRPTLSKSTGYSLMLWALRPFHSLTLVAVVQHLMGLAIAVMVYAVLRRARLPAWGATLGALPVLFDAYLVELEHLMMAETLYTFLIATAVVITMWRARPPAWVALVAGLLLGGAAVVRTAGLPLVVVLLGYLLVRRAGWRPCLAAFVGGAAPLAGYAVWFHAWFGDYAFTRSDGVYLWGRTSSFADCAKINPPPRERRLCLTMPASERPPPGAIIWRSWAPPRRLPGGPVTPANNALLKDFALRAIRAQPGDYAKSIGDGIGMAVSWRRYPYPSQFTVDHYRFASKPHTLPPVRQWVPGASPLQDARDFAHVTTPSRVVEPYAKLLRGYQHVVYVPGPLLAALLLVGAAGFARWPRRLGGPVLLPWVTAVVLLVFPIAAADFDYRYVLPVIPFAAMAAALAFAPGSPPARLVVSTPSESPAGAG